MSGAINLGGILNPANVQPAAPVAPVNPLAAAAQGLQLQNGLYQNALNQRNLQGQVALGQAYQDNTDRTTGVTDYGKVAGELSGSNAGAAALPGFNQAMLQRQQTILQMTGEQQHQAIERTNYLGGALTGLLSLGNNVKPQDILNTVTDGIKNGIINAQEGQSYLSSFDTSQPLGPQVQQHYLNNRDSQQAFANVFGSTGTQNTGGGIVSGVTAPAYAGGGFQGASRTPLTMSPGEAATPTQIGTDPATGQSIMGTKQQFVNRAQGGPGTPDPVFGTGSYLQSPAGGAQPGGGIAMGLPAGQEDRMKAVATNDAAQSNALSNTAQDVPQRQAILGNMLGDLTQFTSGPGNEKWRTTIGGINRAFGLSLDASGVAAAQSFEKFANQISIAQAGSLGAGTNEKLTASMHANPNSSLSVPTNQQVLHILQGNEDAIAAKNSAWQAASAGNPNLSYSRWSTDFNQTFDPRAFQFQRMTVEEQRDKLGAMTPAELTAFRGNYNAMVHSGLITPPQAAAPAAPAAPTVPVGP